MERKEQPTKGIEVIELPKNMPIYESDEPVEGMGPDLVTRFRWRAERRARNLNARRLVPFYRYEVRRAHDMRHGKPTRWRWIVQAYQNLAAPPKKESVL